MPETTPESRPTRHIRTDAKRKLAGDAVAHAQTHPPEVLAESSIDKARRVTSEFSQTLDELIANGCISDDEKQSFVYLLGFSDRPTDSRLRTQFRVTFSVFLHREHDLYKQGAFSDLPGFSEYSFLFTGESGGTGDKKLKGDTGPYSFADIAQEYALARRPKYVGPNSKARNALLAKTPVDVAELLIAKTQLRQGVTQFLRARYELDS